MKINLHINDDCAEFVLVGRAIRRAISYKAEHPGNAMGAISFGDYPPVAEFTWRWTKAGNLSMWQQKPERVK